MTGHDRLSAITALRAAIPYLRLYQGRTFVIKAGGDAFADEHHTRRLMEQVGVLHQVGIHVVLVHGGGAQATALARQLGIDVRHVEGRRVTCHDTREVVTMILNGTVNTAIVAAGHGLGIPCVGLSGVDAGMVRAVRRPPVEIAGQGSVDYGYVGDVIDVDTKVIDGLLAGDTVPVLSPLCVDDAGTVLNVNGDTMAARIAVALGAEKLLFATAAPGILQDAADPASLISYTDAPGLEALVAEGAIQDGMLPKVAAIRTALEGGVPRIHVVSFALTDGLLQEVFTNEGSGTLVVQDARALTETAHPAAEAEAS